MNDEPLSSDQNSSFSVPTSSLSSDSSSFSVPTSSLSSDSSSFSVPTSSLSSDSSSFSVPTSSLSSDSSSFSVPTSSFNVTRRVTVSAGEAPKRLDIFLSTHTTGLSRAAAQRLIEQGVVTVNG